MVDKAADFFKQLQATAIATTSSDSSPFKPSFDDKITALRCAKLSKLAYEPYPVVLQDLSKYAWP